MTVGLKHDQGKLEWTLLPFDAVQEVIKVLMFGAYTKKYGRDNWEFVEDARRRYTEAAIRHIVAAYRGEEVDEESGFFTLAHASCCILFLLALQIRGKFKSNEQERWNLGKHQGDGGQRPDSSGVSTKGH